MMSVEDCDIPGAERVCLDDLATWAADVGAQQPRRCSVCGI